MSIDIHERARIHIKRKEPNKDSETLPGATKTQFLERPANVIIFASRTNSNTTMYRISVPFVSDPCGVLKQQYSTLEDAFAFISDYNRAAHNASILCWEAFHKSPSDILANGDESEQDALWGLIEEGLLIDCDNIFYFDPAYPIPDYIVETEEPAI